MKVDFIFFGTDGFSIAVLEGLQKAGLTPAAIVTTPDRPKGRGLKLTPPPVKVWAKAHRVPILQPDRLDSGFRNTLHATSYTPFIVASYGLILPKTILDIPARGTLNVHPSLLPKYRGATPIESAILADDRETGVTIMLMDEEMDHGPIVASQRLETTNHNSQIPNNSEIQNSKFRIQEWPPRASELKTALAQLGAELLAETIPLWVEGKIKAVLQEHAEATYTRKFTKADGEIDLRDDPYRNFLKIRAFEDSIGTYFFAEHSGKKIRARIVDAEFREGKLIITRIIPEGRKEMSYEAFLRGLR